jgi:hypothetical protein
MTPEEIVEIMNYTRDPILDSFVDKLNVKDKEYKKELYSMIYNYLNTPSSSSVEYILSLSINALEAVEAAKAVEAVFESGGAEGGGGGGRQNDDRHGAVESPHARLTRKLQNIPTDFKSKIAPDFLRQIEKKFKEDKYYLAFYILNYL